MSKPTPHQNAARIHATFTECPYGLTAYPSLEGMFDFGLVSYLKSEFTFKWRDPAPDPDKPRWGPELKWHSCHAYSDYSDKSGPSNAEKGDTVLHLGLSFNLKPSATVPLSKHLANTASKGVLADLDYIRANRFFSIHYTKKSLRRYLHDLLEREYCGGWVQEREVVLKYLLGNSKFFAREFCLSWQDPVMMRVWIDLLDRYKLVWGVKGKMANPTRPNEPARPYFIVLDEGVERRVLTP